MQPQQPAQQPPQQPAQTGTAQQAAPTAHSPEYKQSLINGIIQIEAEISELEQLNLTMNQRR